MLVLVHPAESPQRLALAALHAPLGVGFRMALRAATQARFWTEAASQQQQQLGLVRAATQALSWTEAASLSSWQQRLGLEWATKSGMAGVKRPCHRRRR